MSAAAVAPHAETVLAGATRSPAELLLQWELHAGLALALLGNAVAYLAAAARASRIGSPWPRRRTVAFLAGLVALAAALGSGIDARATELLSAHMVQHLLLTLVVPPLLLLGAPITLALRALSGSSRRTLGAALTSPAARAVGTPAVAWSAFVAVMVGTHFSPLYDAAVRDPVLHALEHLLYLGAGLLFWIPVLGADPAPRSPQPAVRILYLVLAMPPMALVGVALASDGAVRYPAYLAPARELGVSALADQHAAGLIMWLGGSLLLAAVTVAIGWAALLREERRQSVREAHRAHGRGPPAGRAPLGSEGRR